MLVFNKVASGDIIRSRESGHIFLVVYKGEMGLLIVNLMAKTGPSFLNLLLPKDEPSFDRDIEIDKLEEWEKEVLKEKDSMIKIYQALDASK